MTNGSEDRRKSIGSRKWSKSRSSFFSSVGYDNTPMSLFAKRLGLTKAGIYHHFASKEDLLFSCTRPRWSGACRPVFAAAARESRSGTAIAGIFLHEHARMLALDPAAMLLIREARRLSPKHLQEIKKTWRRGFDMVRDAIKELPATAVSRRCRAPTFAAFAGIGMASWIAYWFDPARPDSAESVAQDDDRYFYRPAYWRSRSGNHAGARAMRRSRPPQRQRARLGAPKAVGRPSASARVKPCSVAPYPGEDMDFEYSSEQKLLLESTHKLMQRVATPDYLRRLDRERLYPYELYDAWVEAGLLACRSPKSMAAPAAASSIWPSCRRRLGRYSADVVMAFGGSIFCALKSLRKGSEEQKRYWLPKLMSGEIRMSISMSEPDAGSDIGAMRTQSAARRQRVRHQRPEDLGDRRPAPATT